MIGKATVISPRLYPERVDKGVAYFLASRPNQGPLRWLCEWKVEQTKEFVAHSQIQGRGSFKG